MGEVRPDRLPNRSLDALIKLLAWLLWISLLAACDPVSRQFSSIDRLAASNNTLFAQINIRYSFGVGGNSEDKTMVFRSTDFGQNWDRIEDIPQDVKLIWANPIQYPKTFCRTGDPKTCYRVNNTEQIDISMDAGTSWKKSWKFPIGRKEFLNRDSRLALLSPDPPHEKLEPDTKPKDIVILDHENGYVVLAALGNQGILIQNSGGKWERQYLYKALPLSYTLTKIEDIDDYLFNELFLSVCVSGFLLLIITIYYVITRKKLLPWKLPGIVLVCLIVPFILWAYGIIPVYEIALAGAIVLSVVILLRSYFSARSKERAH